MAARAFCAARPPRSDRIRLAVRGHAALTCCLVMANSIPMLHNDTFGNEACCGLCMAVGHDERDPHSFTERRLGVGRHGG